MEELPCTALTFIKHWSSTQTALALSSGEAELGGLCKGASMALGLRSVADDLGITYDLTLQADATAAIGMARRAELVKCVTWMFRCCGSRLLSGEHSSF